MAIGVSVDGMVTGVIWMGIAESCTKDTPLARIRSWSSGHERCWHSELEHPLSTSQHLVGLARIIQTSLHLDRLDNTSLQSPAQGRLQTRHTLLLQNQLEALSTTVTSSS